MISAGNNACPPIATARSAKIAIATVLWLNKAGIHSILINHPPVITIDRWYVYRSQMGSLWHCFNHIIDMPSSSTCPEFTRQDPVVSLWNLRGRLTVVSRFNVLLHSLHGLLSGGQLLQADLSMQFAHVGTQKRAMPTVSYRKNGCEWDEVGYGYTPRMATLIVDSIEQYDELWDLGPNYSVQVQTKADSLCLSPVLTVINNESIV